MRLRFSVNRGNALKGDVAIDNIRIYEPEPYDVALRDVFNPRMVIVHTATMN